jgi:hypothetical protein
VEPTVTSLLDPKPPKPPPAAAPAHEPSADDGAALVRDLSAPVGPRSPSLVVGLALSFVTFGILPALLWPLRFAKFAHQQKRDLLRLAKWVSLNAPHPATKRLSEAAAGVEFRTVLWVLALTFCAAMGVVYLALLPLTNASEPWDVLFGSAFRALATRRPRGLDVLQLAWALGLSAAYFCQWLQTQLHARSVRRLLDVFNEVVIDEALAPVFLEPVGFAVGLLWLGAGVLLIALGAPWGVCFMLAGGVQSRYTGRVTPRLRSQLAQRVRDMMLLRRPSPGRPVPAGDPRGYTRTRCETPGCRMPLPASAKFCPRCGVRSAGPLDRVA